MASELIPVVRARPCGQDGDGGGGGWLRCGVARSVMRTPVALRRLARLEEARHRGMYAGGAMARSRQKSRKSAAEGEKHATHLVLVAATGVLAGACLVLAIAGAVFVLSPAMHATSQYRPLS